jgi:Tfp pilus assembly protein PilF
MKAERDMEGVREEGAVLEKQFVKDVVNKMNGEDKELGELVLKAYRKRSEMHDLADHGLQVEDMERAHEHVQAALEHDETVESHQAQLGAMHEELKRLEDSAQQVRGRS